MHIDAINNYKSDIRNQPRDISGWTDRAVVLTCWGNTAYQHMTGDTHFKKIPQRVRENWYGSTSGNPEEDWRGFKDTNSEEDWRRLREDFEEYGWR